MAVTYVAGVPVVKITAKDDTVAGPVKLRAVLLVHSSTASAVLSAGVDGSATTAFVELRGTCGQVVFPQPLLLQNGLKVTTLSAGTLYLYV